MISATDRIIMRLHKLCAVSYACRGRVDSDTDVIIPVQVAQVRR